MISELKDWLSVIATAVSLAALLYTFVTRSGKEANEKVAALSEKVETVEDRIARVEGELKGVPDRDSVHKMQIEMVAMRGSIDVLAERLKPVLAITNRMQEAMIEERK
jgi:predicted  nucleic acid-binding Zn-ribbon protein